MLNKIIRKPYRKILTEVTKKVLEKHNPHVIAVAGDGQTSIARELVYKTISQEHPARRNLESPEAEFSVPFTIIGSKTYPSSVFSWIKVLIKALINLKTLEPYSHFLVLEINFTDKELLKYWLEVIQPETLLIVGNILIDYSEMDFKKVVKISSAESDDILGPFKIVIKQIARFYNIDNKDLETAFDTFTLPTSKIRYLPGKNDSTVIDATHYHLPTKIAAVFELVDENEENVVLITDSKADIQAVRHRKISVNPKSYTPKRDDLIVLRGEKNKTLRKFEYLLETY